MGNITATAKVSVGDAKIRRNLNVESATCDLEGAVDVLREVVGALENHLAPLLAPERPEGPCCDRTRGESEVAERILSSADQVRDRSARIRELIDRL